jgi:PBP superfamily domain
MDQRKVGGRAWVNYGTPIPVFDNGDFVSASIGNVRIEDRHRASNRIIVPVDCLEPTKANHVSPRLFDERSTSLERVASRAEVVHEKDRLALTDRIVLVGRAVVHRSDGSGTTFIFTDYLSKVSAAWKDKVGASTAVEWPTGLGAKGNEGVANNVIQTKGAIGYVEYAYAKQNKMTYVNMINKDGKSVSPNAASFQAAAANADWAKADDFYVVLTDQPGEASWPIAGATFILMYKEPQDVAASGEALKFFDWAYKSGDKMAEDLDYVPMPDSVVALIEKAWKGIKDSSGKPVFAMN